jgi:hypothetical protein
MKYYKRLNQYTGPNVWLKVHDSGDVAAWSYDWWQLVRTINGVVYLNTYNYSHATVTHRYKVIGVLNQLGIEYVELSVADGLQADFDRWTILQKDIDAIVFKKHRTRKEHTKTRHAESVRKMVKQNMIVQLIKQGVKPGKESLHLAAQVNLYGVK